MMTTQASSDVQQRIAALAKLYAEQLPQKIAEMQEHLNLLVESGWEEAKGEALYRMLHSMAGTAGTMGMAQVSQVARQAEQILKPCITNPLEFAEKHAALSAAMQALQRAAAEKRQGSIKSVIATPALQTQPMQVLVVDDDPVEQALLASLLIADGHQVRTANDGVEAVAAFQAQQPDLVLMDVIMPNMNGYEAARQIKDNCGKQFVPIIFLTALQDENDLVQCIAAGGDDFIVKPFNGILLRAKIIAMQRIRALQHELANYQMRTAEEIALSKHVFDGITNRNPKLKGVRQTNSSVGHFSGDIVMYARSPSGRLLLMLGDFTGHGLGAALAAMPASDVFYERVAADKTLPEVVLAINRKLKGVLPVGRFCAAVLLEISPDCQSALVWNGGIPGAYLLDAQGQIRQRLASDKLPLGILGDEGFDAQPEALPLHLGEHLLLFTDGVNESRNPQGEMLGMEGAEALLNTEDSLASLERGVLLHLQGHEADDDLTMVSIMPALLMGGSA